MDKAERVVGMIVSIMGATASLIIALSEGAKQFQSIKEEYVLKG